MNKIKLKQAEYLTISPTQTKKLGEIIAEEILKTLPIKTAFFIGLEGDLGGGKTTFLQGFAKGLGIKEKILSPTFVILKKFKITKIKNQKEPYGVSSGAAKIKKTNQNSKILKFKNFYHIDCYRIKRPKEILDLGFKKIIADPKNIVVVEWSDRIRKILPKDSLILKFKFIDKKTRKIEVN